MEYLDYLNYNKYDNFVLIQIQGVHDKAIIPTLEIEMIFENEYNLKQNESFDVCQAVEESCVEYVLDISGIDCKPNKIKEDIKYLIDNYNEPPDNFSKSKKEEYHKDDVKLCEFTIFN